VSKIGRNAPCPCGSGKKYKTCHGTGDRSVTTRRKPLRNSEPYSGLSEVAEQRRREILAIFRVELDFTDDCLALMATLVEALGHCTPTDIRDVSVRDLGCDAFEFLYAAKEALLQNKPSIAFPLIRRAFESTSLSQVFIHNKQFAEKWAKGGKIQNAEVRKQLEKGPFADPAAEIRETYGHYSQGTHANRTHIPFTFLGEGNKFPLGSIFPIDELTLGRHIRHLMQQAYWLIGVFVFHYHRVAKSLGQDFEEAVLKLTPRIEQLGRKLTRKLEQLREELSAQGVPDSVGTQVLQRPR
jgi:hypothetical protein